MSKRVILVTGATGKVGRTFIEKVLSAPGFEDVVVRALCHNRTLPEGPRLEVVRGPIEDRKVAQRAVAGVTHALHLATSKETPETIIDVAIKGLFFLLEEARASQDFRQFILIGGDAAVGHFFYPRSGPITELDGHRAYPGCYALSKVLEEVMLEQYFIQYDLNGCCLRAPWIMEKDDFRYQLSFGDDVFGGPRWRDLVGIEQADVHVRERAVPVMLDPHGVPVKRNFVHVEDLIDAILLAIDNPNAVQQLFNVCMDEPVDYRALGAHLAQTRGLKPVEIKTPYHSTWLDNAKAKLLLGFRPRYDMKRMADAAYDYVRGADDPRTVWYPG